MKRTLCLLSSFGALLAALGLPRPAAATPLQVSSDPKPYVRSDKVNSVIAVGADNHVYEIYLSGTSWLHADLSGPALAPNANSAWAVGYVRSDGINAVVY